MFSAELKLKYDKNSALPCRDKSNSGAKWQSSSRLIVQGNSRVCQEQIRREWHAPSTWEQQIATGSWQSQQWEILVAKHKVFQSEFAPQQKGERGERPVESLQLTECRGNAQWVRQRERDGAAPALASPFGDWLSAERRAGRSPTRSPEPPPANACVSGGARAFDTLRESSIGRRCIALKIGDEFRFCAVAVAKLLRGSAVAAEKCTQNKRESALSWVHGSRSQCRVNKKYLAHLKRIK